MRVLVTGGSGMLGGTLARALASRGDAVTVMQRRPAGLGLPEVLADVTDAAAVRAAVRRHDAVVHLAAKVGVHGRWNDFAAVNVTGTRNVLTACRESAVARLVHVSSPSVAHAGEPLVGVGAEPADPRRARSPYARSKALAELEVLRAGAGDGPAVVAVRPHLVWGPGDPQLVGRIVQRARARRLALVGTGAAMVDTTYVDDAVTALVAALDRAEDVRGRALVVSSGEPRPVAELVRRICAAAGAPPPSARVPSWAAWGAGAVAEGLWSVLGLRADPPMTRFLAEQLSTAHWFDQRRTRELLGWTPSVGLDEGFERLARWYAATGA